MFLLEPLLLEETADLCGLDDVPEGVYLCLQVAAFEAEDAVGQGILLLLGDVLPDNPDEIGQRHDGTAHHKVVVALLVFTTQVRRLTVLQSDGITDFLSDTDLLARAVDELELAFGEENGQRNAREPAASAEIENRGARTEIDDLGDGHRVKHVVLIEVVDVLAGDDIDLVVPVTVEGIECFYLAQLLWRQVGKVFADEWMHNQRFLFRMSSMSE